MRNGFSINRRSKRAWSACLSALALVACCAALLASQGLQASLADNVLRPLLGDARVVALENVVFGLQDRLNLATHRQLSPADYVSPMAAAPLAPDIADRPPDIVPVLGTAPSIAGEGQWQPLSGTEMYAAFIRTDPRRSYSVVNLVYLPISRLAIGAVAGARYPGGPAGPGKVPASIQAGGQLVAAFNGGFREGDGHYGMVAGGVTYVRLRVGMPLLCIFKDGRADILPRYDGKPLPSDVVVARQNGPLLISKGRVLPSTGGGGVYRWAGTAGGGYITWRSGLGITGKGNLVYAVGDSLTPASLARALQLAGCQRAIQLDINAYWVRFVVYQWDGVSYTWSCLIPALANGGAAYLNGYQRDFLYVYKKQERATQTNGHPGA